MADGSDSPIRHSLKRVFSNHPIIALAGDLSQLRVGRFHVAANGLGQQLKLRLPLRNRPASVSFQSAAADFAGVAATSVARQGTRHTMKQP
jgi:hypothetical protein